MVRPSPLSIAAGLAGGVLNVAVVLALYARGGYPTLESVAGIAVPAFALGFLALFVSAHTRLFAPAIGFLAVLAGTASVELTTPHPEWGTLDGYVIVDGPTHVASYANTWYVWLSLVLVAGLLEFGIRRGYGLGGERLRNLPTVPLSRATLAWFVGGGSSLVGAATVLLVLRAGIRPPVASVAVFAVTAAVVGVPLAALLGRGIVSPAVLFAVLVPYFLTVEVFVATDSPVHILLFGPYAIVLAVAWALEAGIRSRLRGWEGGRFADEEPV
ncbi:hypothetical protein [Natrarchaeobius chitinivorans]|uniref:Uncharacterized protein n=1 Tax=Natrarchaeobius chitinivorans TaxID=1679083 RepID=A0A3N6PCK1_NATCH|nr:hypothetical protein [Natrarchaeobius chitinivorans]RQG97209.1 hypothetical protein EA473_03820 [Natrarchaeobius chitinivorans]